jgi:hypothetical protein
VTRGRPSGWPPGPGLEPGGQGGRSRPRTVLTVVLNKNKAGSLYFRRLSALPAFGARPRNGRAPRSHLADARQDALGVPDNAEGGLMKS